MSVESYLVFQLGTKMQCDAARNYFEEVFDAFAPWMEYDKNQISVMNQLSFDNLETHAVACAQAVAAKWHHLHFTFTGWITSDVDGSTLNIEGDYRHGQLTVSLYEGDMFIDPTEFECECPECEHDISKLMESGYFRCPGCGTIFQHIDHEYDDDEEEPDFLYSTQQTIHTYNIQEENE